MSSKIHSAGDSAAALYAGNFVVSSVKIAANANSQGTTLAVGTYEMVGDADFFFVQGAQGIFANSAASNAHWNQAGVPRYLTVTSGTDNAICVHLNAGTGNVYFAKKGG